MTAIELLIEAYKTAKDSYEEIIKDITSEMLYVKPGGKALPLGATVVHLVFSEDKIINSMLKGVQPLYESLYKDNTGASAPMPAWDENWAEQNIQWSSNLKIDLDKFSNYKSAVFDQTNTYLNTLKNDELDSEVDLGGWGKYKVSYIIYSMIIAHTNNIVGEISALKGIQGYKGYSF